MKRYYSPLEEMVLCIDDCCKTIPNVILNHNINIRCSKCNKTIAIIENNPMNRMKAIINWNILIRTTKENKNEC